MTSSHRYQALAWQGRPCAVLPLPGFGHASTNCHRLLRCFTATTAFKVIRVPQRDVTPLPPQVEAPAPAWAVQIQPAECESTILIPPANKPMKRGTQPPLGRPPKKDWASQKRYASSFPDLRGCPYFYLLRRGYKGGTCERHPKTHRGGSSPLWTSGPFKRTTRQGAHPRWHSIYIVSP